MFSFVVGFSILIFAVSLSIALYLAGLGVLLIGASYALHRAPNAHYYYLGYENYLKEKEEESPNAKGQEGHADANGNMTSYQKSLESFKDVFKRRSPAFESEKTLPPIVMDEDDPTDIGQLN